MLVMLVIYLFTVQFCPHVNSLSEVYKLVNKLHNISTCEQGRSVLLPSLLYFYLLLQMTPITDQLIVNRSTDKLAGL